MTRITIAQKIVGATQSCSAGYLKTPTILLPLMLLLSAAIPGTAGTIYVANSLSTIGEYDAVTGATINAKLVSIPGALIESIALAENMTLNNGSGTPVPGPKLFVADVGHAQVSVYDAATGALVNSSLVPLAPNPRAVATCGPYVFVANDNGEIQEFNSGTNATLTLGTVPYAMFIAASCQEYSGAYQANVLVTSNGSGSTNGFISWFIVPPSGSVTSVPSLVSGLDQPRGITVSADGTTVYFATSGGTVSEYSFNTGTVSPLGSVSRFPIGLAVAGTDLFATTESSTVGEYDNNSLASLNSSFLTGLTGSTGIAVWNQCVQAPSGLTAWWTLDEPNPTSTGYSDSIDGNFNGHGSTPQGWGHNGVQLATGETGYAAKFNGQNQYIEVPDSPPLNVGPAESNFSGDFSIDAWVKLDACAPKLSCIADSSVRVILEKRSFTSPNLYQGYSFYLYNQYLGLQLADKGAAPGYTNYGAPNLVVPADGQWHFVAVSITRPSAAGFSVQFTLDNEPAVALTSPARMGSLTNSSVARIGMETISNGSVFNGSIDEVEFFNGRAVTDSEWQSIYDAGTYGKCKQIYSIQ
jgi:hypothetical protein